MSPSPTRLLEHAGATFAAFSRRREWLVLALLLAMVGTASAQIIQAVPGTQRANCTDFANPVANATWCADGNNAPNYTWKVWDGTQYITITGGGGGGGVTGSGTTNTLPLWTNGPSSILGDSMLSQAPTANLVVGKGAGTVQTIRADTAGTIGAELIISGGAAASGNSMGGYVSLVGGAATGTGEGGGVEAFGKPGTPGGHITLQAGNSTTGAGGFISLEAGTSLAGTGGDTFVSGGSTASSNRGGNVVLTPGAGTPGGNVLLTAGVGSPSGNVIINGLKYPLADGTNGQVVTTNGAGVLSFSSAGAGTVTGSGALNQIAVWSGATSLTGNGDFTFNDSTGAFEASTGFTYNNTTGQLQIGGNTLTGTTGETFLIGNGNSNLHANDQEIFALGLNNVTDPTAASSEVFMIGANNSVGGALGTFEGWLIGQHLADQSSTGIYQFGQNIASGGANGDVNSVLIGTYQTLDDNLGYGFTFGHALHESNNRNILIGLGGVGPGGTKLASTTDSAIQMGVTNLAMTITSGDVTLPGTTTFHITGQGTGGAAQCLQIGSTGQVTKTGSACGGSGSSPGGADTNVQFNDGGAFGGKSTFLFVKATNTLTTGDFVITNQATGGANQGLQIDTSGNVTKTGGIPAIPSGALTNHAVLAGRGTTSFGPLSLLTNGQFLIGSTGADPVAASITTSSLTAASGAGTFSIDTPTITSGQLVKGGGSGPYSGLNITGLVLAQGAGAAIVYPGSTCGAGTFATGASASGVLSCGTPTGTGNVNAAGTLAANQIVLGQGSTNVATLGALGTTKLTLHGNAAGPPSFATVDLTGDVSNVLPVVNGGTGLASGTTGGIPYFTASIGMASSGQLVNHAVVIGGGASTAPHTVAALTNGQLLIGSTGSDPVPATLIAGTGIAITNGAGSVTIAAAGSLGCQAGNNVVCASSFGAAAGAPAATNVTALANALKALPATGGKLIIDISGTIDLNADVNIGSGESPTQPNRSVEIECLHGTFNGLSGQFNGTILNNTRTSGTTLAVSTEGSFVITGCGFATGTAGSPGTLTPVSGAAISLGAATNFSVLSKFSNLIIDNSWIGIQIDRAQEITIEGCKFGPIQFAGIQLQDTYSNDFGGGDIGHNFFDSSSPTIPTHGHIYHLNSGAWRIHHNNFLNGPFAYQMDRQQTGSAPLTGEASDLMIDHNSMEGWSAAGINFSRSAVSNLHGFSNIHIDHNEFEAGSGTTLSAISVRPPAAGTNYLNNLNIDSNILIGTGDTLFVNILVGVNGATNVTNNGGQGLKIALQASGTFTGARATQNNWGALAAGGTPYSISAATGWVLAESTSTIFADLTTNAGTAADGSFMYCSNCRGSQDAGYTPGACTATGPATGTQARRQAGSWQC